jgi:demethylmenaquinone methyltransferase/2-methoxy-6-polyprenyl-1,4-benzoquinol methylase
MNADKTVATPEGSGAMFDAIADRYDVLNRLMSLGRDRVWRTATSSQLGSPTLVLDLATGTGDLALEVARTYPDVHVTGLDPSERMLEFGRVKTDRAGLSNRVEYVRGDAQQLPFPNQSFDAITMAFGIRNVANRSLALAEMARVAKSGARVAILELTEPQGQWLGALARLHVHWIVPAMGALISGGREYAYLSKSIAKFPAPNEFIEVAASAGLGLVEMRAFAFGACHLFLFTPTVEGVS